MTWEQIRHLHRNPRVVSLWLRWFGPLLRWLQPHRRRLLLGIGGLAVAVSRPMEMLQDVDRNSGIVTEQSTSILVVVLMFAFVACCYFAATRFGSLPASVRRHPLMFLHATFWALLVVLWTTAPTQPALTPVLAGCAIVMPFLVWRLGYLLLTAQRGKMAGTSPQDHALYLWPVWGGSDTPYGKGIEYLRSTEASDEQSLARSQLAGLKLILLGCIFREAVKLTNGLMFGADNAYRQALGGITLGLPTVDALLLAPRGTHATWAGWVAIYCDLVLRVLKLAAYGHIVVGCLRLAGFNVFRNTYKPLLAETVIEFWNRYYYYFKELLVHFFFFPTFARHFKRNPRLRLLAAVFASAFLGNLYYHAIQDAALVRGDWEEMIRMLAPRANYCFLLALGIYVSMRREQRQSGIRGPRRWPRRALAIFGVWTFYAFINVFHDGDPTLRARVDFLLGLFDAN